MTGIQLEIFDSNIGVLTIDRPHVRNALGWDTMYAFADFISEIQGNKTLQALVITGGGNTFVSGGDLRDLKDYPTAEDGRRLSVVMGDALMALEKLPIITIAAINGPARGGGAEIAMACDIRVMAKNADIGFVHSRLGIITAWGGGQRLLRTVGYARSLELLASGKVLSPEEAHFEGLVSRIAPESQALEQAYEMAAELTANPHAAVLATKRFLQAGLDGPYEDALAAERREFPALWDTDFRRQAVARFLSRSKKALANGKVDHS